MTDDLTGDDFTEHDLPYRSLRYQSAYRTDVRRFLLLCSGLAVLFVGLLVLGPF